MTTSPASKPRTFARPDDRFLGLVLYGMVAFAIIAAIATRGAANIGWLIPAAFVLVLGGAEYAALVFGPSYRVDGDGIEELGGAGGDRRLAWSDVVAVAAPTPGWLLSHFTLVARGGERTIVTLSPAACAECAAEVSARASFSDPEGARAMLDRLSKTTIENTAKALEGSVAGVGVRALAHVLDYVACAAVSWGVGTALSRASSSGVETQEIGAAALATMVIAGVLYDVVGQAIGGATIGKALCGLSVRMDSLDPCTLQAALVRSLWFLVEGSLFPIAILAIIRSPRKQRLGDRAARTVVVHRKRLPADASSTPVAIGAIAALVVWGVAVAAATSPASVLH